MTAMSLQAWTELYQICRCTKFQTTNLKPVRFQGRPWMVSQAISHLPPKIQKLFWPPAWTPATLTAFTLQSYSDVKKGKTSIRQKRTKTTSMLIFSGTAFVCKRPKLSCHKKINIQLTHLVTSFTKCSGREQVKCVRQLFTTDSGVLQTLDHQKNPMHRQKESFVCNFSRWTMPQCSAGCWILHRMMDVFQPLTFGCALNESVLKFVKFRTQRC